MWTDARQATAWAFGWLILATAGFVLARRPDRPGGLRLTSLSWPAILLIAGIARLAPALWLPVGASYDIESYRLVTDALLSGREVYTSVLGRHPYLPFQMYIMGGMASLATATGLPYVAAIKLPAVLADVALTGLIYAVAARSATRPWAAYAALLYALNPISILVTAYHGQFEAVTLLLLALAWLAWDVGRPGRSAVALGFAILNKTWPVVLLPALFIRLRGWRARAGYVLIALGVPVLFVVAYLAFFAADPLPMLRRALTHRGVAGYWGPGAVLNPAAQLYPGLQPLVDASLSLRNWLLAAAVLFGTWWTRRESLLDAFLTTLLAIFAVTVGFGIQWLVWPVPFALLAGEYRWVKAYSLAGALMLAVHLYGLHLFPWLPEWLSPMTTDWVVRLSAIPAWLIVVFWVAGRLRRAGIGRPALAPLRDSRAG
jgi:hypothetical protein